MKLLIALLFIFQVSAGFAQTDDSNSNGNGGSSSEESTTSDNSATNPIGWPAELWDRFSSDIEDELDSQGAKLNASIFESLTDLELYKLGFGDNNASLAFKTFFSIIN